MYNLLKLENLPKQASTQGRLELGVVYRWDGSSWSLV